MQLPTLPASDASTTAPSKLPKAEGSQAPVAEEQVAQHPTVQPGVNDMDMDTREDGVGTHSNYSWMYAPHPSEFVEPPPAIRLFFVVSVGYPVGILHNPSLIAKLTVPNKIEMCLFNDFYQAVGYYTLLYYGGKVALSPPGSQICPGPFARGTDAVAGHLAQPVAASGQLPQPVATSGQAAPFVVIRQAAHAALGQSTDAHGPSKHTTGAGTQVNPIEVRSAAPTPVAANRGSRAHLSASRTSPTPAPRNKSKAATRVVKKNTSAADAEGRERRFKNIQRALEGLNDEKDVVGEHTVVIPNPQWRPRAVVVDSDSDSTPAVQVQPSSDSTPAVQVQPSSKSTPAVQVQPSPPVPTNTTTTNIASPIRPLTTASPFSSPPAVILVPSSSPIPPTPQSTTAMRRIYENLFPEDESESLDSAAAWTALRNANIDVELTPKGKKSAANIFGLPTGSSNSTAAAYASPETDYGLSDMEPDFLDKH